MGNKNPIASQRENSDNGFAFSQEDNIHKKSIKKQLIPIPEMRNSDITPDKKS